MSFRQASQAASMMASMFLKTRLQTQLARKQCQMFSKGFNSGARGQKDWGNVYWHVELGGGVPSGAS
jgi:hypothetical protein